jgi:hypothetical protein
MPRRREISATATAAAPIGDKAASRPRCAGTTKGGKTCPAPGTLPAADKVWCYWHCPSVSEQRKAARSRGQLAQKKATMAPFPAADFSSEEGTRRAIEHAADAVRAGRMYPAVANTVGKLAGVAGRLGELRLAAKIEALERRLGPERKR